MSFPPCPSPPPPLPSPALVPVPLPSPPPLTKKPSSTRLRPLPRAARSRSGDDAPKPDSSRRPSPPRTLKRAASQLSRCRSPPPSPIVRSPPPPVPPIPAFVLTTNHSFARQSQTNRPPPLDLYLDHSTEGLTHLRCESQAGGTLTCMRFLAVHNQTVAEQCGA